MKSVLVFALVVLVSLNYNFSAKSNVGWGKVLSPNPKKALI